VPDEWIAAKGGVSVKRMPTPWGLLDYSLTKEGGEVRVRVGGDLKTPPGGIVFRGKVMRTVPGEVVVKP
jgi:hypothetical protein